MATDDLMILPSILLTRIYYVVREETTYTYDLNDSDELSETGK